MFILADSKFKNDQELFSFLYTDYRQDMKTRSTNHKMQGTYQLLFSSVSATQEDSYYKLAHLSPVGGIYCKMSRLEADETLSCNRSHRHSFYEFMYVLSGELYVNIENQRHLYPTGSGCILNQNVMHAEEYTATNSRVVFLQFSPELFETLYKYMTLQFFDIEKEATDFSELEEFMNINLKESNRTTKDYLDFIPVDMNKEMISKRIHNLFDQITWETISPRKGSSIKILNLFLELFEVLSIPENFSTTPVQIGSDAEYMIYSQIVALMEKNCGRISRSQLSELLNYSGSYLNEISKKYSGLSLFDFGMTFCMEEAARLLTTGNDNIMDIGLALGFSNRSHFYKIFKEIYHMTPAEYRRQYRARNISSIHSF